MITLRCIPACLLPRPLLSASRCRCRRSWLSSLEAPHPDRLAIATLGLESWHQGLPTGDSDFLDPSAGVPLHWDVAQGWQEPDV